MLAPSLSSPALVGIPQAKKALSPSARCQDRETTSRTPTRRVDTDIDELVPCSETVLREILHEFLESAELCMPQVSADKVEQAQQDVCHYFKALPWPREASERAQKRIPYVCDGVVRSYSFLERHVLRDTSIFTTFLFLVDDYGDQMSADLESFAQDLIRRKGPSHPVLRSLLDFLPDMKAHFGRYATDMFVISTLQFFDGCLLEQRSADCFSGLAGAVEFPKFFRLKTGYAEPYAHFVFPESTFPEETFLQIYHPVIPYLMDFINFSNDLISFYKESMLSDERSTYVYNLARAKEISLEASLRETAASTLDCIQVIRAVLAQHPQLLEYAESFIQGFIAYHVTSPRYELARLFEMEDLQIVSG